MGWSSDFSCRHNHTTRVLVSALTHEIMSVSCHVIAVADWRSRTLICWGVTAVSFHLRSCAIWMLHSVDFQKLLELLIAQSFLAAFNNAFLERCVVRILSKVGEDSIDVAQKLVWAAFLESACCCQRNFCSIVVERSSVRGWSIDEAWGCVVESVPWWQKLIWRPLVSDWDRWFVSEVVFDWLRSLVNVFSDSKGHLIDRLGLVESFRQLSTNNSLSWNQILAT